MPIRLILSVRLVWIGGETDRTMMKTNAGNNFMSKMRRLGGKFEGIVCLWNLYVLKSSSAHR